MSGKSEHIIFTSQTTAYISVFALWLLPTCFRPWRCLIASILPILGGILKNI